jgi:hypothetical protein
MPADSEMVKYGAVARGGARFLTRDGAFELASSITNTLQAGRGAAGSGSGGDSGAADDGDVAARTGAYAQLVYRAQVNGMTVEKLTPIIRIDESALMTHIFGGKVLEGTIAARNGPDEYATSTTLPVRIELARVATDAVVTGHIVNARRPVRLSTGRCSAALSATGTRDPLRAPFTDTVKLQRFPSMHAPFDDEMLLKWNTDASNMGTQFYPSAATLLGLDPLKRTWETMLHGNPLSGPAMTLRMVQGGGGAC